MGLAIIPNAITGYAAPPSLANICALNPAKDPFAPPPIQTAQHINLRTTEFVEELSQRFFKQTQPPELKALQKLIKVISKEGILPIRDSLFKQKGYLSRLFSNESWKDWTDNRTPIGKVIRLYCDCVTSSTQLEVFMDLLDRNLLEVSNRDAARLLKTLRMPKNQPNETPGPFPPSIDCEQLDGTNGFILNGEKGAGQTSTSSGESVNAAGDVNGDGIADFIIGAPNYPGSNTVPDGRAYLIFGKKQWSSPISLSDLHGSNGYNGFMIDGWFFSAEAVNGAGDINGDGIDDLIIESAGELNFPLPTVFGYIVFGRRGNWNSPFILDKVNGTDGFVVYGGRGGGTIWHPASVSGAGDINGDGIDDFVIGDGSNANTPSGWCFVFFGSRNSWSSLINIASLNGSNGFILNGENANAETGISVSDAGDVNGDGIKDMIIGAPGANTGNVMNAGRAYILFGRKGKWNSPIQLSDLNGDNGVILDGQDTGDRCGTSVSRAGDVNGDGIDDFIIGAPGATANGKLNAGVSYVVFGSKAKWSSPINFATLNGLNGCIINGIDSDGKLGYSVRAAGDVNGDGIGDLIIGAPKYTHITEGIGKSYIIFGQKGRWPNPYDISALNGSNGFKLYTSTYSENVLGTSVSGAGDINEDGIDDIIVGAPPPPDIYDPIPEAGNVYVVFGKKGSQNPTNPPNSVNPFNSGLVIGLSVGGAIAFSGLVALGAYLLCKRYNRIGAEENEVQPLVN